MAAKDGWKPFSQLSGLTETYNQPPREIGPQPQPTNQQPRVMCQLKSWRGNSVQGKKCLSESKSESAIISHCKDSEDKKNGRF